MEPAQSRQLRQTVFGKQNYQQVPSSDMRTVVSLKNVTGCESIQQRGSNLPGERLRSGPLLFRNM